ncbi:hypothetical protein ACQIBV_004216 [Yersinia enterocolitica]|uniref:hypothetical protein n=1 Tax=Yersinia TaxID=629 RepID=UPI0011A11C49|nr:hypothetical protein [Yersinia alsatica]EKN3395622.1 hypothetical protein [Yersinia enterocolitica]EKN3501184.1 hypothetical protein [Yersinia enterocolitica]EKN3636636.1 hypothetical protein [Yersinia enterocolitica]EKN3687198.1 hypothetical protein [Yersinia enterocolitica]EKN3832533.1 hypothetical protein [Yersinia enterocolitica]
MALFENASSDLNKKLAHQVLIENQIKSYTKLLTFFEQRLNAHGYEFAYCSKGITIIDLPPEIYATIADEVFGEFLKDGNNQSIFHSFFQVKKSIFRLRADEFFDGIMRVLSRSAIVIIEYDKPEGVTYQDEISDEECSLMNKHMLSASSDGGGDSTGSHSLLLMKY